MANLSSNTNLTIPRGAVVKFGLGGIGQAIDDSGTYKLGNQEVILGPYPVAKTITVLVQSTLSYVIDNDGVIDTFVPLDPITPSITSPAAQAAVRGAAPGSYVAANSIVLMGDSITNNSNVNNGSVGSANVTIQHQTSDTGWWTWANILLGGAFNVLRNSGRAGDTTGDMLARFDADVLSYSPAWVLIAGGVNDRRLDGSADLGFDYTVGNLQEMAERSIGIGAKVIIATILPNNAINALGAGSIKIETLLRVNEWIRRYAETTHGVFCVDAFSAAYDQTTLCGARSGMYVDNTHPGVIGASQIGSAVANQLRSLVKPRPVIASLGGVASVTNPFGNLVKFPTMSGTGGTIPTTYVVSGTVPDGWWLQENGAVANAGHTITLTRPARTDFPGQTWWQTVVAWTAAQNTVATFTHRLLTNSTLPIPAGVNAGDIVDCAIELEYSNVTNAGPIEVQFIARQNTTELGFASLTYSQSATTPTPGFSGVVRANGFALPAGADNIFVRVVARNLAGTVGGYTLRIGRVFVGKRQ